MPSYRIYKLADNRIVGVPEIVERETDQAVTEYAKEILDGRH
jgi:hypothetical protein